MYQLGIFSVTEETHVKPGLIWRVTGFSGHIRLASSQVFMYTDCIDTSSVCCCFVFGKRTHGLRACSFACVSNGLTEGTWSKKDKRFCNVLSVFIHDIF